jgi:ribosome-associated protein
MSGNKKHRSDVVAISELLDGARCTDTVALDVTDACSFADFFVVATVTSQAHLRGLILQLDELFQQRSIHPLHPRRRNTEAGWVLLDLGYAVVHLMTAELRAFYELERLWFGSKPVYPS